MREIRVLVVDDDPGFVDLTETALEREDESFSVVTETDAEAALARLRSGRIDDVVRDYDCVVSDYDMPEIDGLELLNEIRADYPDLPIILFTGKGSETVAAEAVQNGVTDYLRKVGGTDQYTILANRIRNNVERYQAIKDKDRTRRFLEKVLEHATDMIAVVSETGDIVFASGAVERILGYTPDELKELGPFALIEEKHRDRVRRQFDQRLVRSDEPPDIFFTAVHKEGGTVPCRARAYNFTDDPDIGGLVVYIRED
jgi:PAS domain S-box-containing protein